MDQRDYLSYLIRKCYTARDENWQDKKLGELFDEASPFSVIPVAGRGVSQAISERNLSKLAGSLGMCLSIENRDRVNVTQNAIATANAKATASSFSSVCAELEKMDGIDSEMLKEVRSLMNDLDGAKDETVAKHAAKTLVDTVIEKCADALPVIAPFVAQAISAAMGI